MSTSKLTRRAALTGTAAGAAAIVAGAAPALADLDQDRAEWLALWQDFLKQNPLACEAVNRKEKAEWPARDHYPVPPKILHMRVSGQLVLNNRGKPMAASRQDIEDHAAAMLRHWGDNPKDGDGVRRGIEKRLAALDAYQAECRAVDERFGVPALQAAEDAAQARLEATIDEITERPATSIVGIAVKLAMARYYSSLNSCDELESACDDALRLAGLPEDMGEDQS